MVKRLGAFLLLAIPFLTYPADIDISVKIAKRPVLFVDMKRVEGDLLSTFFPISICPTTTTTTSCSVVSSNAIGLPSSLRISESLELSDIQTQILSLLSQNSVPNDTLGIYYSLQERQQKVIKAFKKIAKRIAMRHGACAVVSLNPEIFYYDPANDITQEALNELNQKYISKH